MIAKYGQEYYNKRGWAYTEDGPLNGTEVKKWSSDFAAQISEEGRSTTAPVVTWVSPEKGGNGFYKIILAVGEIKDPTILRVLNLEDPGFDSKKADQLREVILNGSAEEQSRFIESYAHEGLLRDHDLHNPQGNRQTDEQSGGRGYLESEGSTGDRVLQDRTGSPLSGDVSTESTVTEQTDARTDKGGGSSSLYAEQEPVITPEVATLLPTIRRGSIMTEGLRKILLQAKAAGELKEEYQKMTDEEFLRVMDVKLAACCSGKSSQNTSKQRRFDAVKDGRDGPDRAEQC